MVTTGTVLLPLADGSLARHHCRDRGPLRLTGHPAESRKAFAAVHVVVDPLSTEPGVVDWEQTARVRAWIWDLGLGVAEAMDTAQRGMGLEWPLAEQLIRRTAADAQERGAPLVAGAGTDHVAGVAPGLDAIIRAYEEQCEAVEAAGATVVVMASRALARTAQSPDDYLTVYDRIIRQCGRPVILHWLGPDFDPELAGYWGDNDQGRATQVVLDLLADHRANVEGVKVSLLDAAWERDFRRRLPSGVRCYTGDDLDYPRLIVGEDGEHSDALLGVFGPIAPIASAALEALDHGDHDGGASLLESTQVLARHLFEPPTWQYKVGIVFLAWLAGHQSHFRMLGGHQSARSVPHLAEVYRLGDELGLFPDPELAASRVRAWLQVCGVAE